MAARLFAAVALACAAVAAGAQTVTLAGQMGSRALLVIDGRTQTIAVGETARGVKLLKLDATEAVVEVGGQALTLRAGAPARLSDAAPPSGAREVIIPANAEGHFVTDGSINGRPVRFLVDTGATLVAIGRAEAERLGIDWQRGRRGFSQTANGGVPVSIVTLGSLRVGAVELYQVEAAVLPNELPGVLLGNSVLTRFRMQRDSDVMRLTLK
jgi:aspartyl protease family protein